MQNYLYMKKIHAFAVLALVLVSATSVSFAQTANTVQKMTGFRGVSLRTYCTFSTIFRASNAKCFDTNKVASINTASVGAIDLGVGTGLPVIETSINTVPQTPIVGSFVVPTTPQIIERTVIVQGTPGTPGLQGPAGRDGLGIVNTAPQVFWAGGGAGNVTSSLAPVSPLPGGALPGQVLTTNASGTVEWQYITLPSASGSPSVLGSLGNVFAVNGLNLATTSTSTTIKLGGALTEDTSIAQGNFNFDLNRNGFSFLNQGTTSIPFSSILSIPATQFLGFKAVEGAHSVFAGLQRRNGPNYPIFEVQALDAATENRGYLAVGNEASYFGFTNGTTTNQLRADATRARIDSTTGTSSSKFIVQAGAGLQFLTSGIERMRVADNGNVGIGTSTPMRPLTVVGNVGGTLAMFQNTNVGAPAGVSFQATNASSTLSNRFGLFLNPNVSGEDRLAVHAVGTGDLWSFSKNGDFVGSLGTSFDPRNDATTARLSVLANDTRPVALFQNGTQSYLQIKNGSGAFPQTYNVGVEAAGGTFNINDAAANQTRLSINRNGNVQIYSMLNVGSYGFGLGNSGDAGFGNSSQAYMRYVQRAHIADSALELYDYQSNLSTVISQSSNGTATEFNKTKKDIDFRIAGTVENNLFFVDATTNTVGIGTMLPSTRLEVNSGIANDSGFAFSQLNAASPAFGTDLKFLTVNALGKVVLSGLDASVFATSSPAGINGSIQFNQGGLFASNANFNWDNINGRLGLGTSVPQATLSVDGDVNVGNGLFTVATSGEITARHSLHNGVDHISLFSPAANGSAIRFRLSGGGTSDYSIASKPFDEGTWAVRDNLSGLFPITIRGNNLESGKVGIFNTAPKNNFSVGGTADISGNLGIGTTTPSDKLSIVNQTSNLADKTLSWFRQDGNRVGSLTNLGLETEGYIYARDTNNSYKANDGLLQTYAGKVTLRDSQFARDLLISSNDSTFEGGTQGFPVTYTAWDGGAGTAGTDAIFRGGDAQTAPQYAGGNAGSAIIRPGRHTDNSMGNQGTPADIIFQGYTTGATASLFELARFVGPTGNFGLGTNTPARKLHVAITTSGQVARFQNADGTCNINPSIFLGLNCFSDKNLKKDIAPLATSLALFSKLNPVNYHWNTEDSSSPLQYGFIAQDIEAVFPSFVTTDSETGIKSVAFGNLIPVTIKAINEINVHLGDLSKENVTGEEFALSTIFKRFTDAFKVVTVAFKNITADKANVKELCLPKSDGTVICLTGDQVAVIAANASVAPTQVTEPAVTPTPTPIVVVPPTPVITPLAPVVELLPVVNPSENPANPASEVVAPVVEIAPSAVEQVVPTPIVEVPVV